MGIVYPTLVAAIQERDIVRIGLRVESTLFHRGVNDGGDRTDLENGGAEIEPHQENRLMSHSLTGYHLFHYEPMETHPR